MNKKQPLNLEKSLDKEQIFKIIDYLDEEIDNLKKKKKPFEELDNKMVKRMSSKLYRILASSEKKKEDSDTLIRLLDNIGNFEDQIYYILQSKIYLLRNTIGKDDHDEFGCYLSKEDDPEVWLQ